MADRSAPIYLTADSQLLLGAGRGAGPLHRSILGSLRARRPRAAYIGASNGDEPAFYSIFEAAMDALGIADRRRILSGYSAAERAFVEGADLILLAGGDAALGWSVMAATGLRESILARAAAGAVLVGVSAGAMQLGLRIPAPAAAARDGPIETFGLVPYAVGVHAEDDGWRALRAEVARSRPSPPALGIPRGGAAAFTPGRLEVFGVPALELVPRTDGGVDERRHAPG